MNASGVSMMSYTTWLLVRVVTAVADVKSDRLVGEGRGREKKTAQGRWRSQTTAGETYATELK